jgi:transposase
MREHRASHMQLRWRPDRRFARTLRSRPVTAPEAGRSGTFLGERYRRIARRHGKKKAVVAIGRSLLVIIIWHLLADPGGRYTDPGTGYYATRISPERRKRGHIRQLEALRYKVTLERAA